MKNTVFTIIQAIILALAFSSCDDLFSEQELNRTSYTGTELRTDGYYWKDDPAYDTVSTIFFYRNGIALYGSIDKGNIEKSESEYKNGEFHKRVEDYRFSWNVFRVADSLLEIEGWEPGGYPHPLIEISGKILNDTTFLLIDECGKRGKRVLNETFHFKQFAPKPDSTNCFIK